MAKVVNSDAVTKDATFDLTPYLDGQTWQLEKGVDFFGNIEGIRQRFIYRAAKDKIEVKLIVRKKSLYVTAVKPDAKPPKK
jgi:hypothetical protein